MAGPPFDLVQSVSDVVEHDTIKPGRKPGVPPKFADGAVGAEKRLLDAITGLLVITGHPVGNVEHFLLMALHQHGKRLTFPLLTAQDKRKILVFADCFTTPTALRH